MLGLVTMLRLVQTPALTGAGDLFVCFDNFLKLASTWKPIQAEF